MSEQNPQPTQQRGRRWKRMVVFALLLIGGAVVNIAIAWGCAWWSDLKWRDEGPIEDDAWLVAWLEARSDEYDDSGDGRSSPEWFGDSRGWGRRLAYLSGGTMRVRSYEGGMSGSVILPADRVVVLAGWPFYALHGDSIPEWTGSEYITHTTGIFAVEVGEHEEWRPVPLIPIWPGFIFNTLFYAALFWLILFAPFTARRALRCRRGQCEQCAYPIGTSPICTECGAAVRANVTNAPRAQG